MKKLLLSIIALMLFQFAFSQNHHPDYLDGRIMFRISGPVLPNLSGAQQEDPNRYSLTEELEDYPELEQLFANYEVTLFERPSYFTNKPSLMNIFRVKINDASKVDELVNALREHTGIDYADKEPLYHIGLVPNDTYHTGSDKWFHTLVGSEAAWNTSLGRSGVKIAIIDNAVFAGHADLTTFAQYDVADNDNNATPPFNYNQSSAWSHGTHCAGLATADINNNNGIASLGGNAELIGVKCTPNSAPSGNSVWYSYDGVQWACMNGAHIVSMSYGGPGYSSAMQSLINAYPGVVFMAAAGNDGNTTVQYPAGYTNVIGVGSVDANDSRSSFSNYNGGTTFVDLAAPGGFSNGGLISSVYTTGGNGYARQGGTSMATPFAAGLAGLILAINPQLTPAQVLNCMTTSGVTINQNIGPRIDALGAVQCASATTTAGAPIADFLGLSQNIVENETVQFYDNSADGGNTITTWEWTFPGGTPNSHIGQNPPPVTYATAGTYNVSLKVVNAQDSSTEAKSAYINVSIAPYGEWIKQNSAFTATSRGINYISIVDQNTVWATAYDGSGGGANIQQFTKTTNGGTTWTPGNINVGNNSLGISMVHALDGNTAWAVAYPTGAGQTGGIWKTTNGGTTWTRQNTATYNNAASFSNVVHFWDANDGFCQGDPINGEFELYTTTNGGTTWTLVSGASIPNPQTNEFGYTRQIEVVGNSVWYTTSTGRIYHSTDKGVTWSVYNSPVPDFGGAVTTGSSANLSFSSLTDGLIVDINGNVWSTTNSGATWTQLTTTGPVFTNGLCFIEGTNIAFTTGAGTGPAAGSSFSLDGGVTWNQIDTEQHLFVDFINSSVGWSGSFNQSATDGGIWKWNDLSSTLNPAFNGTPAIVCVGDTVFYSDQTTGATPTSWNWSFPGGTPSTSTQQNPDVVYTTPGIYPVSLTVSDGSSQSTYQDTAYVEVVILPSQPSSITGTAQVCPFDTETYNVTSVNGVFYSWTYPNGWSGTSNSSIINISFNDTAGTLSVTADNVCGSSTPRSLAITMTSLPTAGFNFVDNGAVVNFTNTTSNGTSYNWDFGDGNNSTTQDPSHTYASAGTYTVMMIATNSCGSDTSTQQVTVVITGIEEVVEDPLAAVRLYPNPANDQLIVDGLNLSQLNGEMMQLNDVLGRTIQQIPIISSTHKLNLSGLAAGVYFITIRDRSYKVLKE